MEGSQVMRQAPREWNPPSIGHHWPSSRERAGPLLAATGIGELEVKYNA